MFPAVRTPPEFELLAKHTVLCAHPNDLATDPGIASAVSITTEPGQFPTPVLGVISQQLANGVARKVAAQPDALHLVLNTTYGHRRPA
jgi:hypothetical protein